MVNVEIDNFRCSYFLSRNHGNPYEVKKRLDSVAENLLAKECESMLSRMYRDDESLVFIRDLKIKFPVQTGELNSGAIGEIWGRHIASSITKAIANPRDNGNVVIFSNQTEYLSCFVKDFLAGSAWNKWYYRELDYLKKFDARGAVKELFKQNRENVEDILLLIAQNNALEFILNELTGDDAATIFNDYLDISGKYAGGRYEELFSNLYKVFETVFSNVTGERLCSFKNCMGLYIRTLQQYPDLRSVSQVKEAVKLTLLLKEFAGRPEGADALVDFIRRRAEETGFSNAFALLETIIITEGKEGVLEIVNKFKENSKAASSERTVTPYGGLFILIRTLMGSGLHTLMDCISIPRFDKLYSTRMFLLFLAQKISGQKTICYSGIDSGLLFFAGFRNQPMPGLLEDYAECMTPETCIKAIATLDKMFPDVKPLSIDSEDTFDFGTVLNAAEHILFKNFTGSLRRFEKSTPEYVLRNFLLRQAEIILEDCSIKVKLAKKPLDTVLRISGHLDDVNSVYWLDNRTIKFEVEH